MNLNDLCSSDEFLMSKAISFIVLTKFFHFNELKILRQPGYFIFLVNQQIFLQCKWRSF